MSPEPSIVQTLLSKVISTNPMSATFQLAGQRYKFSAATQI